MTTVYRIRRLQASILKKENRFASFTLGAEREVSLLEKQKASLKVSIGEMEGELQLAYGIEQRHGGDRPRDDAEVQFGFSRKQAKRKGIVM